MTSAGFLVTVPHPGLVTWPLCVSFQGLPYKHLITHHQEPSHRYLISTYDDHYNRHSYNPGVPALRSWSGQKLLWLPEKSDFPLVGTFIIGNFPCILSIREPQMHRAEVCSHHKDLQEQSGEVPGK